MPCSPASNSMGSPGIRRMMKNVSSVMPMKVGTTRLIRVNTNRSIAYATWSTGEAQFRQASPVQRRTLSPILLQIDVVEDVQTEGIDLVILHVRADRLVDQGVSDRYPRSLGLELDLGRLVESGTLLDIARLLGLGHFVIERLVAPPRPVAAVLRRTTGEQLVQEVVRIAVVARPAQQHHVVLAGLG